MNNNIPNINNISPDKINLLSKIIKESKNIPQNEMIPFFLNAAAAAKEKGINFSDKETEIIINSLKSNMSKEQINRLDSIIQLAKNLRQ